MATTPGVAIPGTPIPANAEVSPGGAQGLAGLTAGVTTITQPFTVPPVGGTQAVTVTDASTFLIGQIIYLDQAGGGGAGSPGALQITNKVGNQLTLLNPYSTPAIPLADPTQPGLLTEVSGKTTDFIDGTNSTQDLATAIKPIISVVRQRAINALGNSTFEVDQQRVGASMVMAGGARMVDRWISGKVGTWAANSQQMAGLVPVPGTNFYITQNFLRITLTTQEATMGAGDLMQIYQFLEGPQLREIQGDVHSEQLLVRSSVAPLSFALYWCDYTPTSIALTTLCTIPNANQWTLIQKPNIPAFPTSGKFSATPGQVSALFKIILAAGSNFNTPNDGLWMANTSGALVPPGMSNFCASPVNSTFDIAFAQAQPGPECGQLLNLRFTENLDQCIRYYAKSMNYATAPLGGGADSGIGCICIANGPYIAAGVRFAKRMAKAPTMAIYNRGNTAVNGTLQTVAGSNYTFSSVGGTGENGFGWIVVSPNFPAVWDWMIFHYTADTGW